METLALRDAICGLAPQDTAAELGRTVHTVHTYWKRIFQKTKQSSQREVLAHLIRYVFEHERRRDGMRVTAELAQRLETMSATFAIDLARLVGQRRGELVSGLVRGFHLPGPPDRTVVVRLGKRQYRVTPSEHALVEYLASRAGSWVTTEELCQRVLGKRPDTRAQTLVRVHFRNLRRKVPPLRRYLESSRGAGFMLSARAGVAAPAALAPHRG
jgi:hypothetical protein